MRMINIFFIARTERQKHQCVVPFIDVVIGGFLHAPWIGLNTQPWHLGTMLSNQMNHPARVYIATFKYPSLCISHDLSQSLGLEFALFLKLSKGVQEHNFWPKNQDTHTFLEECDFKSRTLHVPHPTVKRLFICFPCFSFSFPQESLPPQC